MNIYSAIPLTAGVIYILLLGLLIAHRPWRRRHKLFAGLIAGALLWSASDVLFRSTYLADYKLLLAKVTICSFMVMLLPFCYFVTTFYERPRDNWLVLAYLSVGANIILAALGYQPAGVKTGISVYPQYNILLLLVSTAFPFLVLTARAVYFLFRRLMLAENALIHAQVTYLLLTVIILTLSAVSNVLSIGRQLPISHIGNLLAASLLGYAILRHQLVDLKSVAGRGLVYGGVSIAVAVSYLILLFLFQPWFHSQFGAASIAFILGLALIVAVALYPLRKVLQHGAEQLLYPSTHDYRRMLLEFGSKASSIIDIDELGNELTRLVASAVGAGKAYLLLPESIGGDFKTRFAVPESDDDVDYKLAIRADSPIVDWLRREERPLFCESLNIMPQFRSLWEEEKTAFKDVQAELFVPLVSRGNLVGLMVLSHKEPVGAYAMSDIELLGVLTHETAIAIENAQLHAKIEGQTITDGLTQLYNRQHFVERLKEEISRKSRYGGKFSLAIIDIDDFKKYNDTLGHLAGDDMLVRIGSLLKTSVRGTDMAFRYGGDEFALLMPYTMPEGARVVTERFRQIVAAEAANGPVPLSVSVGLASWPDDGTMYSELIQAADSALYGAKRGGGNRVSVFSKIVAPMAFVTQTEGEIDKESVGVVRAFSAAVEAKDRYAYGHAYKVAAWSVMLAKTLGLTKENIATINMAAMLHDVGKLGIPDEVLRVRGALDSEQWKVVRAHPKLGANILSHIPSLSQCVPAVTYHHEHYDGTGYPDGLKGEAIPLEARIIAIADAFTSMTSSRPYRDALSYEEAIEQLRNGTGKQFDPKLVEIFLNIAKSRPFDIR